MPPRIDGRLHLSLIVGDAESSAAWYRRAFGFEVGAPSGMQPTMPDPDGAETIEQPEQPLAGGRRQLTH